MKTKYYIKILLAILFVSLVRINKIHSQSVDQNYIKTRTYLTNSGGVYLDVIQYYNGLGLPIETVQKGVTPSKDDLVSYQEYDRLGRESNKWLPTVFSFNNGGFVDYNGIRDHFHWVFEYPEESKPYSFPVYEASPLNRVLEQYGAGEAWQNNSRSIKTSYLANISGNDTLNCIYYKVTESSADTIVSIMRSGNYETSQLYVTRTTDEDGNTSFEFKDKQDQVVLTRQIVRNGSTKIMYDTYYIYDDFGNLAAVLPPLASDAMKSAASWSNVNSTALRDYAYLYIYDGLKRCKAKRLPGTSWSYYIYDRGDRLIFSQNGEQRKSGEWSFTLPDVFGRTCVSGICMNSLNALSNTPSLYGAAVNVTRDNTTGTYKGYSLSGITLTSPKVLSVNYYDDYAFMGTNGIPSPNDENFRYEAISDFGYRYDASSKTLLTGTLIAQLDESTTPTYLCSVMYYDYQSHLIQTKSNNQLSGGFEKEYVAYTFTGKPLKKKHIHMATGKATQTEIYSYSYDHAERLLSTKYQLNTNPEVTLVENTYDRLGRLKTSKKKDEPKLASTYTYNVRSWLKSSTSPLFSQTLYYNDSYGNNTPCYNGNISAMSWTTSGDKTRGYTYSYDNLSRLTKAGYLEAGTPNASYSTSYGYDKHGNMTSLLRNGRTGTTTFGTIDNLSMSYAGNQLVKADDAGTNVTLSASMDFKNNSNAAKEYYYDLNGNLTRDLNKGVVGVTYNLLNLPRSIRINNALGQGTNTYTYAADGRKLQSVIGSKKTDYVGNMIYENGVLKRILIDGGYMEGDAYYFYLTDHLGNNRVVANANGGIVQTNHYYPFGMSFAEGVTTSKQPYKYNGKELDTEKGLNLYDYSARLMDPVLGRFGAIDPKAEKYYGISPYAYVGNNPLKFIDPDGKDWFVDGKFGYLFFFRNVNNIKSLSNKQMKAYNIDTKDLSRYENLGGDDLFDIKTSISDMNKGANSELFMRGQGYKAVDRLRLRREKNISTITDADGGYREMETAMTEEITNRYKSYAKSQEDLYRERVSSRKSKFAIGYRTESEIVEYKVPSGASLGIPRTEQDKRREKVHNVAEKFMKLIYIMVQGKY